MSAKSKPVGFYVEDILFLKALYGASEKREVSDAEWDALAKIADNLDRSRALRKKLEEKYGVGDGKQAKPPQDGESQDGERTKVGER